MSKDKNERKKLIIVGTGGHCRSIIDIIESNDCYCISGLISIDNSDGYSTDTCLNGYPVIGHIDNLIESNLASEKFIIAIGDNAKREEVKDKLLKLNVNIKFATCIHRNASISPRATVGAGCVIMAGVVVNGWVSIGEHCIINSNATIEHDTKIGDFVTIAPGVVMGGSVTIGEHSVVSIGCTVIHGVGIGKNTVIGASSLVNKPINPNVVAYGIPAHEIRKRKKGDPYL